ncbi:hypothetical protein [Microbacterium sp. CJ88]|uniref:hypothetical protein n=1 Tax=Microbacterium sp. CJ88 TaxID=3445672 RepID=UPI003F6581A1
MAGSADIAINIIGNAQSAVSAFNEVGDAAAGQQNKFDKMKAGVTIASAAVVGGVIAFGTASVDAYSEAEQSQAALTAAYEKFPNVANVQIDALRALNSEIQHKTGFDDDALAASQATLAQFGLTGDQIQKLTPLMADYAAKTGKDITGAAEDMGKAMLGQTRALKAVGIDLPPAGAAVEAVAKAQDAASKAAENLTQKQQDLADLEARQAGKTQLTVADQQAHRDALAAVAGAQQEATATTDALAAAQQQAAADGSQFDQIVKGLDGTVGGFAETMGGTAAGKAKILEQNFGDIQETVGEMLIPALTTLTDVGAAVTQWLSENPALVQGLAIAAGALSVALIALNIGLWASTTAFWAQTAALLANPITWIILTVIALVAAIVLLATNWDQVTAWISEVWGGFITWITDVINGFVSWWNQLWGGFANWISEVWTNLTLGIQLVWNQFIIWLAGMMLGFVTWWNGLWAGVGQFISDVWNNFVLGIQLLWGGFWGWITGAIGGFGTWISDTWNGIWNGLVGIVRGVWNGVLSWVESGVNGAIDLINGMIGAVNNVGGIIGISVGLIPHVSIPRLASGGVTSGPMLALIGDNPGGRELVTPLDRYEAAMDRAYTAGQQQGNGDLTVHLSGDPGLLEQIVDVRVERGIKTYEDRSYMAGLQGRRRFA